MYGQFGNPYGGSYANMQNRLATMEQQYQPYQQTMYQPTPMQQPQANLMGKVVTSMEEAKASPIAVDGSMTYFPCPAQDKIFIRFFNEKGMSVFKEYVPKVDAPPTKFVEESVVAGLIKRIEKLEKELGYESDASNPNVESK